MRIRAKINVTRIDKAHLYQGQAGKYLNIRLIENKDGEDRFGNTHFIVQEVSKEAYEKGQKGPIIGGAVVDDEAPIQRQTSRPNGSTAHQNPDEDDDVPF